MYIIVRVPLERQRRYGYLHTDLPNIGMVEKVTKSDNLFKTIYKDIL